MHETDHARQVEAWLREHAAKDATAYAVLGLFEAAWGALWRRAEGAIGEIVLESIAALIRDEAAARFPFLPPVSLKSAEISFKALLEPARAADPARLREALAFILTRFITIVGDLTDQILTPGLYEELRRRREGAVPPRTPPAKEDASMTEKDELMSTGIRNFDGMLAGGLIRGSSIALTGPPGSGKTILAQEIAFRNASPASPAVFFSTLSEPGAKTLFYLKKFDFFDQRTFDESLRFVDLGILLRTKGLRASAELFIERLAKLKPALVVIDSFKVFEDMAESREELRKFSYELVVNLIARKCTTLFLGEFLANEPDRSPLNSIIDGSITMTQRETSGEHQRYIQIPKMRGLAHSRDEHTFKITAKGIEVFAPRLTIKRSAPAATDGGAPVRCRIGIPRLDDLLDGGVPLGSSLLIAGVAGTGKTVLGLEFVYRGALAGEKGIVFSFEETDARLRAAAAGLGWDLDAQIDKGMVKIVFIPQPEIMVEHHLLMMQEEIEAMGAARVCVDSLSVFLHKLKDLQLAREKVFQLASIVQNAGAVGFFATDIPYGAEQISRFGVEETVVDGVIILTCTPEGLERQRYIEIYKLRNTAHLKGRHTMKIGAGGIQVFPRYREQEELAVAPPPAKAAQRLPSGIAGLDALLGSGLLARSMTLVSGSSGIGKTLFGVQFLLEGAQRGEPGLFVTLDEAPAEILANAAALGLPLRKAVDDGLIDLVYLPPTRIRSTQLLAVLTERIGRKKTPRLVLDGATHIAASGMPHDDVRELVYDLAVRFKELGVTSLFTLESDLMYSTDSSTDAYRGFAPLADNVIVLRFVPRGNKAVSTLMVVKTRGSTHDHGLHGFTVAEGGVKIGPSLAISGAAAGPQAPPVQTGRKH